MAKVEDKKKKGKGVKFETKKKSAQPKKAIEEEV